MTWYVKQNTRDTYKMYNLTTNRVTNTRDVKWTNKLFGEMMNNSE